MGSPRPAAAASGGTRTCSDTWSHSGGTRRRLHIRRQGHLKNDLLTQQLASVLGHNSPHLGIVFDTFDNTTAVSGDLWILSGYLSPWATENRLSPFLSVETLIKCAFYKMSPWRQAVRTVDFRVLFVLTSRELGEGLASSSFGNKEAWIHCALCGFSEVVTLTTSWIYTFYMLEKRRVFLRSSAKRTAKFIVIYFFKSENKRFVHARFPKRNNVALKSKIWWRFDETLRRVTLLAFRHSWCELWKLVTLERSSKSSVWAFETF